MLLKVFIQNVYFGGYLDLTWHAVIVYMFHRWLQVLHSVGDNALISGFGKGPIASFVNFTTWLEPQGLRVLQVMCMVLKYLIAEMNM